jgi:hypothetical protein
MAQAADSDPWAEELFARCLLVEGKLTEAQHAIDLAEKLSKTTGSTYEHLIEQITAARVIVSLGRPAEAIMSLDHILPGVRSAGFFDVEIEARLALGEVKLKSDRTAAFAELETLERDARRKGFGLVARKAAILRT